VGLCRTKPIRLHTAGVDYTPYYVNINSSVRRKRVCWRRQTRRSRACEAGRGQRIFGVTDQTRDERCDPSPQPGSASIRPMVRRYACLVELRDLTQVEFDHGTMYSTLRYLHVQEARLSLGKADRTACDNRLP